MPLYEFLPSSFNTLLLVLALAISAAIPDKLVRLTCILWTLWLVPGTLNIYSNVNSSRYFTSAAAAVPNVNQANTIHLYFMIAFAFGALVSSYYYKISKFPKITRHHTQAASQRRDLHPVILVSVCIFPVLYAAAVVKSSGILFLFSDRDVSAEIYTQDFGPLYFLQPWLLLFLCIIYCSAERSESPTLRRVLYLTATVAALLSVVDGKRRTLVMFLASIAVLKIARSRNLMNLKVIMLSLLIPLASVVLLVVRSASSTDEIGYLRILAFFGDEYWDFAKSVTSYSPEYLQSYGYDWLRSTIASMVNGGILALFGIEKAEWVARDSGITWSILYNSPVGIRTGIVSELYFGFGWWGSAIMLLYGVFMAFLAERIRNSQTRLTTAFWISLYGLFLTGINGQTSVLVGRMTSEIYALCALLIANYCAWHLLPGVTGRSHMRHSYASGTSGTLRDASTAG